MRKAVAAISEISESPEMHERRRIFEEQAGGWRALNHSGSRSSQRFCEGSFSLYKFPLLAMAGSATIPRVGSSASAQSMLDDVRWC